MSATTKQSGPAHQYAKALLEIADERQQLASTGDEMRGIKQVLDANPSFAAFLRDPGVSQAEREKVLERVLAGRVSPLVYNTLRAMNAHGRLGALGELAESYQQLLDEKLGKIEVDVTVAQRLDDQMLEQVRQQVSRALKKDAVVRQSVDESIIGGLVLRVEDKLIDASVRSQLQAMKKQLMAAAPN